MNWSDIFQFLFQTPTGLSLMGSLAVLLAHALGVQIPVVSSALNGASTALGNATGGLVGGQGSGTLTPTSLDSHVATSIGVLPKNHPFLQALRQQLSQATGYPPTHPGLDVAVSTMAKLPIQQLLAAVPGMAPFLPFVGIFQQVAGGMVPGASSTALTPGTGANLSPLVSAALAALQAAQAHPDTTNTTIEALLKALSGVMMPTVPAVKG